MMRSMKLGSVLVIVVALVASAAGCSGGSSEGRSHGIVRNVDAEARKVTLEHEEIPGLMKAMTMTFDVAPGVALGGLGPGSEVVFRVEEEGGVYTVTEIGSAGP